MSSSTAFAIGDMVRLISRVGLSPKTPDVFEVLFKMPPRDGKIQYRIRNEEHGHERVEKHDNLVALDDTTEPGTSNPKTDGRYHHG